MTDPFRDEAAAAMQRVEGLQAENEELRARLAEVEGAEDEVLLAELRREVEAAGSATLALRMRVTELEQKPRKGRVTVQYALVSLIVGMLMGGWFMSSCR
jgi:hypothetical protein